MSSDTYSNTRKFRNPVFERLSRTPIGVPIGFFLAVAAGLFGYGLYHRLLPPGTAVAVFVGAVLWFSLTEYLAHRYVFHMATHTPLRRTVQYLFHGIHHDHPRDKTRLAMPLSVSIPICLALFFGLRWLMGPYVYAFLPGFVTGYALYLLVHYAVHALPPPRNALRVLWVNHAIHHYKNDEVAFGVSSPLWDVVFGTMPARQRTAHQ